MRHIISILLENESGALSRVAGLFSARGYNIQSLTVAPPADPSKSRMTLVTSGSDDIIEQITKQLNKLVEVVKLMDLTEGPHIEREMMLIKVRAEGEGRSELKRLTDIFRGRIIVVTPGTYVIELTGTGDILDAFLDAVGTGAILETVRSGVSGIARGEKSLHIYTRARCGDAAKPREYENSSISLVKEKRYEHLLRQCRRPLFHPLLVGRHPRFRLAGPGGRGRGGR